MRGICKHPVVSNTMADLQRQLQTDESTLKALNSHIRELIDSRAEDHPDDPSVEDPSERHAFVIDCMTILQEKLFPDKTPLIPIEEILEKMLHLKLRYRRRSYQRPGRGASVLSRSNRRVSTRTQSSNSDTLPIASASAQQRTNNTDEVILPLPAPLTPSPPTSPLSELGPDSFGELEADFQGFSARIREESRPARRKRLPVAIRRSPRKYTDSVRKREERQNILFLAGSRNGRRREKQAPTKERRRKTFPVEDSSESPTPRASSAQIRDNFRKLSTQLASSATRTASPIPRSLYSPSPAPSTASSDTSDVVGYIEPILKICIQLYFHFRFDPTYYPSDPSMNTELHARIVPARHRNFSRCLWLGKVPTLVEFVYGVIWKGNLLREEDEEEMPQRGRKRGSNGTERSSRKEKKKGRKKITWDMVKDNIRIQVKDIVATDEWIEVDLDDDLGVFPKVFCENLIRRPGKVWDGSVLVHVA